MMMKYFFPAMAALLLAGCADPQPPAPTQKAQKAKVSSSRSLDMEALCKNEAAERYNTGTQKIDVTGFEQFGAAMRCVVLPSVKRVLSAHLTQTGSFCTFPCAKFLLFPVSYCISCSQRVY